MIFNVTVKLHIQSKHSGLQLQNKPILYENVNTFTTRDATLLFLYCSINKNFVGC